MKPNRTSPSKLAYEYSNRGLTEKSAAQNPLKQFERWFNQALKAKVPMPNAMTLATISTNKRPDARVVLLKDYGKQGFVFFTHYNSPKGLALAKIPHAAVVFYWPQLERQVRISGRVKKISEKDSGAYFKSRPHGYQLGALVSKQSRVIKDRSILEKNYARLEKTFKGQQVERPGTWGGYVIVPDHYEFWQGRPNRLHDRLQYKKLRTKRWSIKRLAP